MGKEYDFPRPEKYLVAECGCVTLFARRGIGRDITCLLKPSCPLSLTLYTTSIKLKRRLYEAPVDLVGKQVRLLYHEHDPARVEVLCLGNTYGFAPMTDVHVNCRVKRDGGVTGVVPDSNQYKGGNLFTANNKEDNGI